MGAIRLILKMRLETLGDMSHYITLPNLLIIETTIKSYKAKL